jgi:hypothetical protein
VTDLEHGHEHHDTNEDQRQPPGNVQGAVELEFSDFVSGPMRPGRRLT